MRDLPNEEGFAGRMQLFEANAKEVDQEAQSARRLVNEVMADPRSSAKVLLARIENRSESLMSDGRPLLAQATDALFSALETQNVAVVAKPCHARPS